ncbi:hypothetical protein ALP73_200293 [Pseudomonas coronafaciens pv. garcae]|uniref:Uncharacterized protein n=1 Tax=Pseudomonas coronafaciens pv. garcae TaxID=251653 RepID=A0AB37QR70_9PSED|nr:hypothetical protein ALP74_200288 [Pseudomonas coronafaciens pv. garcae]RMS04136.1 hypothetical protein ALP73_200293 [Pseudomonas coronafaciens pv. garcae]
MDLNNQSHLARSGSLQSAKLHHGAFHVNGVRAFSTLLCKPEFQQTSNTPGVATHFCQVPTAVRSTTDRIGMFMPRPRR